MSNNPKIEGGKTTYKEEYEIIPPDAVAASRIIVDIWKQLGKPDSPLTPTGEKLMKIIISVWEDLYPEQRILWYAERTEYQKGEKSIKEQVRGQTGRSLASYPLPIYSMMKKVFPNFDAGERKNCIKMVKKYPMFRYANKI